jgi:5-methylthioadenosine/S-adenosylhomocysteine deaminase
VCAGLLLGLAIGVAGWQDPPPRDVSLVVSGGIVLTVDADRRVLDPGAVAIDGGEIVAVGTVEDLQRQYRAADTLEVAGQVVLPGLINTHTHAPMVLYRGLADDLPLMEWLERYIFPAEARTVSPAFVRLGTRLAALEMIQSGTTTYADMYYFEEEIARETKRAGLRGILGQTIIQFPAPDAPTPAHGLRRAEAFIQAWRDDALVTPAVAPHAMYTLDGDTLTAARDLASRYAVPLLIHLAETEEEVRIARERHQMSPTRYLDSIGFWSPLALAAHAVWVADEDIDILRRHGVGLSHNPESNMKLASGTAPVPRMIAAGAAVGLGTDGAASNNNLDMFEAMRQTALLHKLQSRDPSVMPAPAVLELATIAGARALGRASTLGSLEPGKRADLITVSTAGARQTPMYDPVSHLVYVAQGGDVRNTIVDGRVLMRDRRVLTLDEPAVLAEARSMARRVREAVDARE